MKGSVLFELVLEAMKNKKNNWPFSIHLVHPFSSISRDVLGLARSKIRRGFLLCRLGRVKPYLQRIISHFVMHNIITIVSRKYAPLSCMLASGNTGEGAYARECDISV